MVNFFWFLDFFFFKKRGKVKNTNFCIRNTKPLHIRPFPISPYRLPAHNLLTVMPSDSSPEMLEHFFPPPQFPFSLSPSLSFPPPFFSLGSFHVLLGLANMTKGCPFNAFGLTKTRKGCSFNAFGLTKMRNGCPYTAFCWQVLLILPI